MRPQKVHSRAVHISTLVFVLLRGWLKKLFKQWFLQPLRINWRACVLIFNTITATPAIYNTETKRGAAPLARCRPRSCRQKVMRASEGAACSMLGSLFLRCIIYAARLSVCVFIGEQSLAHLSSFISHLWRQVMVCTQQRKKVVVSLSRYIYCCWLGRRRATEKKAQFLI
jgi:hypothetical protein